MAKEKAAKATPINELVEQEGGAILDDLLTTGIKARDDSRRSTRASRRSTWCSPIS
jgi:hypothetical protein